MRERDHAKRCIVTGYDGSEASKAAVAEAAARAGGGGGVVIVYAYAPPSHRASDIDRDRIVEEHRAYGRELLAQAASECSRASEDVSCETTLVEDRPAQALLDVSRAREAAEIVVGSRGAGRAWKPIGSVSSQLLEVADRPVLVVSAPDQTGDEVVRSA